MKTLSLISGGVKLDGAIYYPLEWKEKNPAILFVHGWTSDKSRSFQYAEALVRLGYLCFLFDMRGHGTSEGDRNAATRREFFDDVLAAYDFLIRVDGADTENISAIGSSFGGYLLALLIAKRNIKNLVLRAPADYPQLLDSLKSDNNGGNGVDVMEWRNQEKSQATHSHSRQSINSPATY